MTSYRIKSSAVKIIFTSLTIYGFIASPNAHTASPDNTLSAAQHMTQSNLVFIQNR